MKPLTPARFLGALADLPPLPGDVSLEGATVTASCLCSEIDPSDRPCLVCDALAYLDEHPPGCDCDEHTSSPSVPDDYEPGPTYHEEV